MPAYRLVPACKDYLWGGHHHLRERFGIDSALDPLAEAWVLSCHPDGPSVLADGPFAGRTLSEYVEAEGRGALGTNCAPFAKFPLLVKLIDAGRDLSIQVHPSDIYALAHEGQCGKTEMWVVLSAAPGASLYYGLRKALSREELAEHIRAETLTDVLRKVPAKVGDVFLIPAGTLHAIGAGVTVAEIQQNSNVTYRVYDYGRVGADGQPRPLHVDKALEVADLAPTAPVDFGPHLGSCAYFAVDGHRGSFTAVCGGGSFHALLAIGGAGTLLCGGERSGLRAGDCFFLPAGSGRYAVEGDVWTLTVSVPGRA